MGRELPKNWISVQIKDIAETQSGGTPSTTRVDYWDGDVPWINSGKLKDSLITEPSRYITALGLKSSSARLFAANTVVIALTGATTGKVGFLGIETSTNQSVTGILPNNFFEPKFIFYQLIYLRSEILNKALGTAQPHINKRIVDETKIYFAPLSEQKRIAAKLDEAFNHLDSFKVKLDRIPKLLKKFRQTILAYALTGRLTVKFRAANHLENKFEENDDNVMREIRCSIPSSWRWLPFSSIATVESNLVEPLDYLNLPLIAPDNIESGTGKLINRPSVSDIMPKSAKHHFKSGSIVYSKIRPYLSKVILADFEGLCSADVYPISTIMNTKYLFYYLLSDLFLSYSTSAGERSVLPKINQKELAIIPVSVPPIEEQDAIVELMERNFDILNNIQLQYDKLRLRIEPFQESLLRKAFSGELVAQNEEDEPADVLLKRIERLNQSLKHENKKTLGIKI